MHDFFLVAKFISTSLVRVNFAARPEFFKLLPLSAILQSYDTDEEVANLATNLLVVLAQTMTLEKNIPQAIASIADVVECPLWSSRSVISEFLPVFVFYNMATINSNRVWVFKVCILKIIL